jgi:hypothetical protein
MRVKKTELPLEKDDRHYRVAMAILLLLSLLILGSNWSIGLPLLLIVLLPVSKMVLDDYWRQRYFGSATIRVSSPPSGGLNVIINTAGHPGILDSEMVLKKIIPRRQPRPGEYLMYAKATLIEVYRWSLLEHLDPSGGHQGKYQILLPLPLSDQNMQPPNTHKWMLTLTHRPRSGVTLKREWELNFKP